MGRLHEQKEHVARVFQEMQQDLDNRQQQRERSGIALQLKNIIELVRQSRELARRAASSCATLPERAFPLAKTKTTV